MTSWNLISHVLETRKFVMAVLHLKQGLLCDKTLSQTINLRLSQTERVCRRQFQIWWKKKKKNRLENTVGKEEIARNEQYLLFPQCFQKTYYRHVRTTACLGKGQFLRKIRQSRFRQNLLKNSVPGNGWLMLWCFTPFSTVVHLYRGGHYAHIHFTYIAAVTMHIFISLISRRSLCTYSFHLYRGGHYANIHFTYIAAVTMHIFISLISRRSLCTYSFHLNRGGHYAHIHFTYIAAVTMHIFISLISRRSLCTYSFHLYRSGHYAHMHFTYIAAVTTHIFISLISLRSLRTYSFHLYRDGHYTHIHFTYIAAVTVHLFILSYSFFNQYCTWYSFKATGYFPT